jgi:hypothetical protein
MINIGRSMRIQFAPVSERGAWNWEERGVHEAYSPTKSVMSFDLPQTSGSDQNSRKGPIDVRSSGLLCS